MHYSSNTDVKHTFNSIYRNLLISKLVLTSSTKIKDIADNDIGG